MVQRQNRRNQPQVGRGQPERPVKLNEDERQKVRKIIQEHDALVLKDFANTLGRRYAQGITTSQIRNVLDRIQRMHSFEPKELFLLEPLLAYAVGKQERKKRGDYDHFYQIIREGINYIRNEEDFKFFCNFVEAIVAYHRYYGGQ